MSVILGGLLTSGCVSFPDRWHEAHQQSFDGQSLAGVWAGPWQEGDDYSGYVKGVLAETDDGEWEAIVRVVSLKAGLLNPASDRHLYYWDFRVPLEVTPQPGGTYHIAGESRQFERLVGIFDLVIDGTADSEEISLGFSRGVRSGRMRLTRITPRPMVSLGIERILGVRYDSQEVRDQVRDAARLPLFPTQEGRTRGHVIHASAEGAVD